MNIKLSVPQLIENANQYRNTTIFVHLVTSNVNSFLFLLAIVVSALLRFTNSDYPFGIFNLFLHT